MEIEQQKEIQVEADTDHKQETPSNGAMAVVEPHENNNEVEITNNEVYSQSGAGFSQSANEVNEVHGNLPNVPTCDINNGGCDQICNMVQNENSDALIAECSCSLGYYLDLEEGKHCIGKCFINLNLSSILSARCSVKLIT